MTHFFALLFLSSILLFHDLTGQSWSTPPLDIGNASYEQGVHTVVIDGSGNALVLYLDVISNLFSQTLPSPPFGGTIWENLHQFSPAIASSENIPKIAVNKNGFALAVWDFQISANTYQVLASHYTPGSGWGPNQTISTVNSSFFTYPSVAIDSEGNGSAVWDIFSPTLGGHVVRASIFKKNEGGWQNDETISEVSAIPLYGTTIPEIGMSNGNEVIAIWQRIPADNLNVQIVESKTYKGSWPATATQLATGPLPDSSLAPFLMNPQIAVNSIGEGVAIWQLALNTTPQTFQTQAASYAVDWFGLHNLSTPSSRATNPQVAINGDNEVIATWEISSSSSSFIVQATKRDPENHWKEEVDIFTIPSNFDTFPAVAIDGTGRGLLGWSYQTAVQTNFAQASYSDNFNHNSWSTPQNLNSTPSTNFTYPNVAINHRGEGIAVWNQSRIAQSSTIVLPPVPPPPPPSPVPPPPPSPVPPPPPPHQRPKPPRDFRAVSIQNTFPLQVECKHLLTWRPSTDDRVVGYDVFQGKELIATVGKKGPFLVEIKGACCNKKATYKIESFNKRGIRSRPIRKTIT